MYFPLNLPPGIYRNGTEYSAKGRYYDGNLIRFYQGTIRPIGGWRVKSTSAMSGSPRAILAWLDNSNPQVARAGIGTHSKLYVMARTGAVTNITPWELVSGGTLGTDPFATTNGSATVTVTHTSHGRTVGARVYFKDATAGGGITIDGEYAIVTVPTADTYTITHSAAATSTDTTTGGSAVIYYYFKSGTLSTDPFAVTNGSATVTVTHTAHGRSVGDWARFSGATAGGGITISGDYQVQTVPNANSYTITHSAQATSTDSTTGGSAVVYAYELAAGRSDGTSGGAYGAGNYGAGTYGTPRPDTSSVNEARMWSLDTWGEWLLGTPGDNSIIYEWRLNTSYRAIPISNAPPARAIVVTRERILMALGASSNPRRVWWSDQEDFTQWTPAATNLAGDFDLQTPGKLMCGRHVQGGVLLLTDVDVFIARFVGYPLVYTFDGVGEGCGIISKGASADMDSAIVWMSQSGFWIYNGYVQPLPCEVSDYVFSSLNRLQASKITCEVNSTFNEVTWRYPSSGSTEIDRYVTWNRVENTWVIGSIARLAGTDRGPMQYPLLTGSDGYVYEHEVGFDYDDVEPYLESGPIEIGNGERNVDILNYLPDEKTSGDVTITIKTKQFPNGSETESEAFTAANPRNLRISGRQIKVRYTAAAAADWRVGVPRLEVRSGSKR